MNWLIIYAHPSPSSFNQAMVDAVVASISPTDDKRVINLYNVDFDAKLSKYEFIESPKYQDDYQISNDISEQIEHIVWSDRIVFIYPIWWAQMPALMKGNIDRVFYHGWVVAKKTTLYNKRIISLVSAGLSEEQQKKKGLDKAYEIILNDFIYYFTGRKGIFKVFSNVNKTTVDVRKGYLDEIKIIIRQNSIN